MAYDAGSSAGPLKLNFTTILHNYEYIGSVPRSKLTLGLEPGEQFGGGSWEGAAADRAAIDTVTSGGYGAVMYWAINQSPVYQPESAQWCPILSAEAFAEINPIYPYSSTPPSFSKINVVTGWAL